MRTYVPSSIRVPTAAASPARVSRPVSFGSSMASGRTSTSGPDTEDIFVSEDEQESLRLGRGLTSYPSDTLTDNDGEDILWARWDVLDRGGRSPMQLLFIAYASGIQIWDCSNLSSVVEVLNLCGHEWRHLSFAAVLPQSSVTHPLGHEKPLIGILVDGQLVVYSLSRHHIVTKLPFSCVDHFTANDRFIVISTTNPPTLHVLSASSFITLFTLAGSAFIPFSTSPARQPSAISILDTNKSVPLSNLDAHSQTRASCVYAFSHRLFAYVSPAPVPSSSPSPSPTGHQSFTPWKFQSAELSNSAIKVGESILAGMKTLGGLALNAAMAKTGLGGAVEQLTIGGNRDGRFFSRSAPTTSGKERSDSIGSAAEVRPSSPGDSHVRPQTLKASGQFVTVLDLAPLLTKTGPSSHPKVIAEFMASKEQPITNLVFSSDGTSLIVVTQDGQVFPVFRILPAPPRVQGSPSLDSIWHIYNLRRGWRSGIIEEVAAARDFRWVAIGTRNRTIHIFPVNPYGGRPDKKSHLEGRVQNCVEMQPSSTELSPIVRLYTPKKPPHGSLAAPLVFTFIDPSQCLFPGSLLPQAMPHMSNVQDLLVFDPVDGILSLRRLTIEIRSRDSFVPSMQNVGGTSVSLPGMSRLGVSPPSSISGPTRTAEASLDLGAKESLVATWSLKRRGTWGEVKRAIGIDVTAEKMRLKRANWLAQAELSTCSKSPKVLPRSVYLSHQFSFHALVEDYHALIHRGQLDIPGVKLEVRKQVEISAYPAGIGESFVEGFTGPRAIRPVSSSFDEPLATALAGGLDYSLPSQPIIPMLPNGARPRSFKDSIPIRSMAAGLSDGMTERLGRIRMRTSKASSPPFPAQPDSVPLEFDEDDEEDFPKGIYQRGLADDGIAHSSSRGEGDSGASVSISTPSTLPPPLDDDESSRFDRYGAEEKESEWAARVLDDVGDFDDIDAVGLLDEEQILTARRKS